MPKLLERSGPGGRNDNGTGCNGGVRGGKFVSLGSTCGGIGYDIFRFCALGAGFELSMIDGSFQGMKLARTKRVGKCRES